jgi:hypothetical protein
MGFHVERSPDLPRTSTRETMLPRSLTMALTFVFHLAVAVLGTLVVESPFERSMVGRSVRASLFRVDLLTSACAFGLGYLVFQRWRPAVAKWVWVAGLCWFSQRVLFPPDGNHVVLWEVAATRSVLFADWAAMQNWTLYTLFSLRVISYSAGAWSSSLVGDLWKRRTAERWQGSRGVRRASSKAGQVSTGTASESGFANGAPKG